MIVLLSPAKNLNFDPVPDAPKATKPALLKDMAEIAAIAKTLSARDLKRLMGISDKLAELNRERFQALRTSGRIPHTKQAALAFNGDVYLGLDANTFSADDLAFAQQHVRILSGLYGLLRPLDAIQPYRLEMGTRLKNPRGGDLYAFWKEQVAKEITRAARGHDDPTVVNLASNEYFKAVDVKALDLPVITAVFKEEKNGAFRSLMYYAKRARGLMARWIVRNRITHTDELKRFDGGGYRLNPELSGSAEWVFARKQPKTKAEAEADAA